tara:strand:- start:1921 stop:2061 length:141 start_codon:yes stop_codon:yes gene_type:complete
VIKKLKELMDTYKLEEYELVAVPYIIGIFIFIFSIVGLVSLSYILF